MNFGGKFMQSLQGALECSIRQTHGSGIGHSLLSHPLTPMPPSHTFTEPSITLLPQLHHVFTPNLVLVVSCAFENNFFFCALPLNEMYLFDILGIFTWVLEFFPGGRNITRFS